MQHAPPGRLYLAKKIDNTTSHEPKESIRVTVNGQRFQLNSTYNDGLEGLRIAQESKDHLEKVCKDITFAILRMIRTPEGNVFVQIPAPRSTQRIEK